jgi:hypothetical protein
LIWRHVRNLTLRSYVFWRRVLTMVREPIFIWMTVLVHGLVLGAAGLLYLLEHDSNQNADSFLNCFYWAMATMTTVGYGDVVPLSEAGRILAIALMMLGSLAHVFYTAVFASALLSPELQKVQSKLRSVTRDMQEIEVEVRDDELQLAELKSLIQKTLDRIDTLNRDQTGRTTSK